MLGGMLMVRLICKYRLPLQYFLFVTFSESYKKLLVVSFFSGY